MILTEETRSTRRETYISATLSTTNPTRSSLGMNPVLRDDKVTTELWQGPNFVAEPNNY